MIFRKHIPAYPLSLYIQHIIYAKGPQPLPYVMELPEGKVNLVIELEEKSVNTVYTEKGLSGKHIMKKAWFSGTQAQTIVYENNTNSAILSVRFTTGGFYALTKLPVQETIFPGLEVELVFGNIFIRLYESLINEEQIEAKFEIVEQYFKSYLSNTGDFENSIIRFVDKNLDKPVDWLVNKSGYSQKHLIHTVKKQSGFSPKYLQRLNRFQKVITALQSPLNKLNWSAITFENGYYDQAHFIKEFVHFTGLTPAEYFRQTNTSEYNKTLFDVKILSDLN